MKNNTENSNNAEDARVAHSDLLAQKVGDLEFAEVPMALQENRQYAHHAKWGSITVLDRMTGYGYRDVETGFRDPDGRFWLAAGNFSIRMFPELTIKEAISKIKENANVCQG